MKLLQKIGDISSLNVINLSLCSLPHPLHYLCGDSMEMLCLKQAGTVGSDSEITREKNVQFIKFWSLSFVKQNTRLRLKKRIHLANARFYKSLFSWCKALVEGGLFLCYGRFPLSNYFLLRGWARILSTETSRVKNKVESPNLLKAVFKGLVDSRKSVCYFCRHASRKLACKPILQVFDDWGHFLTLASNASCKTIENSLKFRNWA